MPKGNGLRHEPAFQEILAEALAQSDPTEAFRYHLKHLLLGSSNPGAANDAAHPDVLVTGQPQRLDDRARAADQAADGIVQQRRRPVRIRRIADPPRLPEHGVHPCCRHHHSPHLRK